MLQIPENKISLRNSSGGPDEYLRTLQGTLPVAILGSKKWGGALRGQEIK